MNSLHLVIENYLVISLLLFVIGMLGVLLKRTLLFQLVHLQLMLVALYLALGVLQGGAVQEIPISFVVILSFVQLMVGLGVATYFYRQTDQSNSDQTRELRQ